MTDVGFASLAMRMVASLGVVLSIVGVAYVIARRRAGGSSGGRSGLRSRRSSRSRAPLGLEVVGRAGIGRTTALVAVRFGERIVLVSANEEGPATLISEMEAQEWDELLTVREEIVPERVTPFGATQPESISQPARKGFLDALRDATTRHG